MKYIFFKSYGILSSKKFKVSELQYDSEIHVGWDRLSWLGDLVDLDYFIKFTKFFHDANILHLISVCST